jgi:hypothetical protein
MAFAILKRAGAKDNRAAGQIAAYKKPAAYTVGCVYNENENHFHLGDGRPGPSNHAAETD